MRYADYISQTLVPISLQGPNGGKWYTGLGEEKDYHKQRIMDSIALRFPTYAPADSLIEHGLDRQIERAPGESDASYRKRLLKAHATWKWSGTDYGVMLSFEALGWTITHMDAYDSLPALWPYEEESIQTYTWCGPGNSVAGTPVASSTYHGAPWSITNQTIRQLSNLQIVGASEANTDGWTLSIRVGLEMAGPVVTGVFVGLHCTALDEDVAGGVLVGNAGGTVTLTDYGWGLSATVDVVANAVEDFAGRAIAAASDGVVACMYDAPDQIGYVIDDGVAPGDPVRVATRSHVWIVAARDWTPPPEWTGGFDALWPVLDAHAQATLIDYRPFLAFGKFGGTPADYVAEVYPTKTVQRLPLLVPWGDRVWPASCAMGEDVLVFGGWSAGLGSALFDTLVWDWGADDWRATNPATHPSARHSAAACSDVQGGVILVGGNDGATALADTWRFALGEWTELAPAFAITARYQAAMARLNGRIYLFGGTMDGLTALAETWVWDGSNWTRLTTAHTPAGRFGHTLTTVGGKLVMFGGRLGNGTITNEIWTFDGTDWTLGFCLITARVYHGAAAISDHELLVFGGDDNDSVFAWNADTGSTTAYNSLPWTWSHGASAALRVKRTIRRRGQGDTRDGTHTRGVAFTAAECAAMVTSIRKWKGADSTYPAMYVARTPGGFHAMRSPAGVRGVGIPRGGRITKISVGER